MKELIAWLWVVADNPEYTYQGPRLKSIGENSGEEFRELVLIPWLDKLRTPEYCNYQPVVDFDGTEFFNPSFLHEAFTGAVKQGYSELLKVDFVGMPREEFIRVRSYILTTQEFQELGN